MKARKKLSSIKKYKRYERILWHIPPAWAVIGFKQLFLDNLQFVSCIGKIAIRTKIKSVIQNCTITSMWFIKIPLAAAWIFWIINAHQRIKSKGLVPPMGSKSFACFWVRV